MERLNTLGFTQPLKDYIASGKPYFGICLGLQTLFEGSEESPGTAGLGLCNFYLGLPAITLWLVACG